jgi:uncharacterized protein YbjT (DUF2867 family)
VKAIGEVIDAMGKTDKHIVQKLIEKNIPVRVLSRNPSKANFSMWCLKGKDR